jgi:sialate O-acetylesterase
MMNTPIPNLPRPARAVGQSRPFALQSSFVSRLLPCLPPAPILFASLVSSFCLFQGAVADITLPSFFSDHMVLQSGAPVPVWGKAEPDETVTVEFEGEKKTAQADGDGKWSVKLDPLSVNGEGHELTVTATPKSKVATRKISDVLVGEVWLCSGQSNMAFQVNRAQNFAVEKAAATLPKIRMFTVTSGAAVEPQQNCRGQWTVCSPDTVGNFSAAAYFFGRDIHAKLGFPVGLINSSVGGTEIEAWTSLDAQKNVPEVKPTLESWEKRVASWDPANAKAQLAKQQVAWQAEADAAKAAGKPAPREPRIPVDPKLDVNRPANLYNGKIAPLIPFAIKGAIWYQGESNADTAPRGLAYRVELPLLIEDWRKRWGATFPFAWVQLPDFNARNAEGWCLVREAMLQSLKVPETGMAIALGLGEATDIHPTDKQDVGHRLALWALDTVYGGKGEWSGPLYTGNKIDDGAVTITFSHAKGLMAKGGAPAGFVIAGEDKRFKPATAKISGEQVIVSSSEVPHPVAVRYAWADNPVFNLYNAAGIPASPFRTDDWPVAP